MSENVKLSFYNASFKYESTSYFLELQLDIDAKDNISKIGASSNNSDWLEQIKQLKKDVIGQNIIDLNLNDFNRLNIPSFSLIMAIQDYTGQLHQTFSSYGNNADQVICRCQGIDVNKLEKSIENNQADKNKIIKELKISLVCGGCREEFNTFLANSNWRVEYFAEIPNLKWQEMIEAAFLRAKQTQSQLIPTSLEYKILKYQNNQVKLRVEGNREGQNRFELTEIVQNFLREKIHPEIKVSLVL